MSVVAPPAQVSPVVGVVNAVANAATGAITNVAKNATSMFNNASKTNSGGKSVFPSLNGLNPFGANSPLAVNKNVMNTNASTYSKVTSFFRMLFTSRWFYIVLAALIVIILAFTTFKEQSRSIRETIAGWFTRKEAPSMPTLPPIPPPRPVGEVSSEEVTMPPMPPQDETPSMRQAMIASGEVPTPLPSMPPPVISSPEFSNSQPEQGNQFGQMNPPSDTSYTMNRVETVLPSSGNEVYNVSDNKFTYYDAEPLCKALGAELATYEQVKSAWSNGADWCNYGWVKGQMAVYPTQQNTYEKLQTGPEDQHKACGTPGINGGHFDNPEMQFGVNCYGKKPSQSAHDKDKLMDLGKVPRTPETLKVDALVNQFKSQADSLFVRPFSDNSWSKV